MILDYKKCKDQGYRKWSDKMKILFISDIHGIWSNLQLIEEKLHLQKIDKLVCLGDIYFTPFMCRNKKEADSDKVLAFLNKYADKLICMRGNCDSESDVAKSDFPINEGFSLINVDDLDIYITHGNLYNFGNHQKFHYPGVLVYGHEHKAYIKQDKNMTYINVGSLSLPVNGISTYVIYEKRKFTIYDVDDRVIDSIEI